MDNRKNKNKRNIILSVVVLLVVALSGWLVVGALNQAGKRDEIAKKNSDFATRETSPSNSNYDISYNSNNNKEDETEWQRDNSNENSDEGLSTTTVQTQVSGNSWYSRPTISQSGANLAHGGSSIVYRPVAPGNTPGGSGAGSKPNTKPGTNSNTGGISGPNNSGQGSGSGQSESEGDSSNPGSGSNSDSGGQSSGGGSNQSGDSGSDPGSDSSSGESGDNSGQENQGGSGQGSSSGSGDQGGEQPKPQPGDQNQNPKESSVTINGKPSIGLVLVAQLESADGMTDTRHNSFRWFADGVEIPAARYVSYRLTGAEKGKKITVQATYTNSNGESKTVYSEATAAVTDNNTSNGKISVSGTNRIDYTFTANVNDEDGADGNVIYRWYDFYGIFVGEGQYLNLTEKHVGMQLIVQAKYTDKNGNYEVLTSGFTGAVEGQAEPGTGVGILPAQSNAPRISLSGPSSVKAGERAVYTVTLDKPAEKDVSADIRIKHGTTNSNDAAILWNWQRVTVKAGETSGQFWVGTTDNGAAGDKNFTVSISNAVVGTVNQANVTPISQTSNTVPAQSFFHQSYRYPLVNGNANAEFLDYWKAIHTAGSGKIPFTIFMADAEPNAKLDPGYVKLLDENLKRGYQTVGYIRTNHQTRPIAEVKAAMAKFVELYGEGKFSGFYFDEVAGNSNAQVAYMAELYNYTKTTYRNKLVVANPGGHINDALSSYADIFMTNESSADSYINNYQEPRSGFENDPANYYRIYHTVYAAKASDYQRIIDLSRKRNAGYVYITTDSTIPDGRPYNDLPVNFVSLVDSVNNLGKKPTDPNRSATLSVLTGANIGVSTVGTTLTAN